jgi:hypothetical protein
MHDCAKLFVVLLHDGEAIRTLAEVKHHERHACSIFSRTNADSYQDLYSSHCYRESRQTQLSGGGDLQ